MEEAGEGGEKKDIRIINGAQISHGAASLARSNFLFPTCTSLGTTAA